MFGVCVWRSVVVVLLLATSGCVDQRGDAVGVPAPVATLRPTTPVVVAPTSDQAAPSATADSGWQSVAPGVDLRSMRVAVANSLSLANVTVARFDPAQVRFHVGYAPHEPRSFGDWVAQTQPLAAINGGFFSEGYESTALVISGGSASGESYVGRGGMFAVAADGSIVLRSLADAPYAADEPLTEAMQSWPMLVKEGGVAAYTDDDNERDRRSVVARDRAGRVLLLVCSTSSFTLQGLSTWLVSSDLDIDAALNLDGGSSTSLYLRDQVRIDPFGKLPLMLLVDSR